MFVHQVLIQESGERRIVGVGVVYQGYNCHYMPGWIDGTVGYHADDGKIFEAHCGDNLGREVAGKGFDVVFARADLLSLFYICSIVLESELGVNKGS